MAQQPGRISKRNVVRRPKPNIQSVQRCNLEHPSRQMANVVPFPIQFRPYGDRTKSRWGCRSGCSYRRLIYYTGRRRHSSPLKSHIGAPYAIGIRGMHGMGLLLGKRALARSALPAAPRKSHWQVQFWCITPAGSFWRATATMSPAPSTTASFRPDFVPGCARCMWRSSSWRAVSGGGWSFQDNG